MLSIAVQTNVVRLARNLIEAVPHQFKHFSFILRKNNIISVGWNKPFKTHPQANKFGYRFNSIHSELDSILKFDKPVNQLRNHIMVNIRLDKQGRIRMSRPCETCQRVLSSFLVGEVWYSTNGEAFEEIIL
jgi:deoxycytidylate deaminase